MIKQYEFEIEELGITTKDIASYISGSNNELPDLFLLSVDSILQKISNFNIYAGYKTYDVILKKDKLTTKNIEFSVGNEVGLLLKNSDEIAVFACTVGHNFEKELQEFNDIEDTYVKDIIGTVIVEKSINKLLEIIQNKVKDKDLKTTNTVSPGNCGWSINEQEKLFKLLPYNFLSITLNSHGMMHPVKSISGIIGIGKNVSIKHTECEFCSSKNCLYRKKTFVNYESKK